MKYFKLHRDNTTDDGEKFVQQELQELLPVRKLNTVSIGNVYYLPVSNFPLSDNERKDIKIFLDKLCRNYIDSADSELLECIGILGEAIEFDVVEKIGINSMEWSPGFAIAIKPELPPPHLPSREEVSKLKGIEVRIIN